MQPTDEILAKQAILGDKRAFGKLVERYQNAVYGLAYHFTRNVSDAHDLAQEAFLQAYLKLSQLKEPAKFAHWLRRITANICKMWLRRAKPEMLSWEALKSNQTRNGFDTPSATQPKQLRYYKPTMRNELRYYEPVASTVSSVEIACEKRELQRAVQSSIDSLSEKNRLAVTLYYIDGLTQKEISDFLDLPLGTIKSRLHEAKKHLQKELIQRGFGDKPSIVMVQESLQSEKLPDDFRSKVEEMLKSADSVIRRKAVHALLEHHPEDQTVEDLIIEAAKDEDSSVREKALTTLGWVRCEKAIPLLVECLKNANYQIRKRAQWSLNRIGTEQVVLEVLKLIDYPDEVVRRHAVDVLKGICTEAAVSPLLCALQKDTDIGVRERIISVLADIENEDVANALVQLLWDDEPRIRRKAMDALPKMKPANIAPTLLKALDDENIEIQQRAIGLIGILSKSPLPPFFKGGETAAEEQLIEKLDSPNPDIVFKTAEALGIMKSEKAIEPLTKLLQEAVVDAATTGNRQVGSSVAKALGNISNTAAVPPLLAYWERLISDGTASSLGRMIAIIRALGQIGDSRAVPHLANYLDSHRDIPFTSLHEDSRWQWHPIREILKALALIGDPASTPHVAQLTHCGYFIGEEAIQTLGHLGPATIPALSQMLAQKESSVSHWLDKRWRAAQSLGQIGHPDALESLSEALKDEAPVIRFRAAEALGKLNSEDAISPLRTTLQDKEYNVRKAAVESLKRLGVPEKELPKISKSKGKRKSKQESISPEQFRGHLPAKDSLRRAILGKFVEENFEKGIIYAEKQVDDIIHRVYEDHCSVRRYLVDYGMMSRDRGQYTVENK